MLRHILAALRGRPAAPGVGTVKALALGPRDVLIVRTATHLSQEHRAEIGESLRRVIDGAGLPNQIAVLPFGIDVEVLRVEGGAPIDINQIAHPLGSRPDTSRAAQQRHALATTRNRGTGTTKRPPRSR